MNAYSNIRFWSKLSSGREIDGGSETSRINEINNPALLTDLNNAAKVAGVIPVVTTITEGKHGDASRHYSGFAVDIAAFSGIGGYGGGSNPSFIVAGNKLSVALQQLGYTLNVESGNVKAVLWKSKGHHNHLHVSNKGGGVGTPSQNQLYGDFTGSNNSPLSETPTGLQYFHFDQEFIGRGINLYKEYYNKRDIEDNKTGSGSGDIGFVPLTLDITFDGISGWVIYDKLIINQKILPPQYPEHFNFVIMGVNHSLSNNGWETKIQTLSVPDIQEKVWNKTNELTTAPQVAGVPGGNYNNLPNNLPPTKIRQIFANVEQSGNLNFNNRHTGNGSATGPYGWLLNTKSHLYDMWVSNIGNIKVKYTSFESLKGAALDNGSGSLIVEEAYQLYLTKKAGTDIKRQLAYNLQGYAGLKNYDARNFNATIGSNMTLGTYINKALK